MTGMETVPVVIRFQICIFDILNTANGSCNINDLEL